MLQIFIKIARNKLPANYKVMKKMMPFIVTVILVSNCGNPEPEEKNYGDTITAEGAIPSTEILSRMEGKDSMPMKVTGTITEVCQKKGCWMHMDAGNGKMMRVGFRDYAFFIPKNASGKTAILEGYAFVDTTSVADLRHYAEDAGASKDSIEKITQPEVELNFDASGVIIRK